MITDDEKSRIIVNYEGGMGIKQLSSLFLIDEKEIRLFLRHRGYRDCGKYKRVGSYPPQVMGTIRGDGNKHKELIGGGAWN